jgi:hypothetical protein
VSGYSSDDEDRDVRVVFDPSSGEDRVIRLIRAHQPDGSFNIHVLNPEQNPREARTLNEILGSHIFWEFASAEDEVQTNE